MLPLQPPVAGGRGCDGACVCTALCDSVCSYQDGRRWHSAEEGTAGPWVRNVVLVGGLLFCFPANLSLIRNWLKILRILVLQCWRCHGKITHQMN